MILLREALRLQPDLVEAREDLGLALRGAGDLDGAIEELRGVLRKRPDAGRARFFLATALMAKADWASARLELEELLRQEPGLVQPYYSLGVVRYALGDLEGAIEAYRRVLAHWPQHPDARYSLAVVLKLARGDAAATQDFLAAAQAGHARAQHFAGTAYSRGFGVEPNLALAILWWSRAADQGESQASMELAVMRQIMVGRRRRGPPDRPAVERAFHDYRATLWNEFPELTRNGPDDTIGAAMLRRGRAREAVTMLIREASAFSEPAQALLESLYVRGVEGQVPAHDGRILDYLKTAADEGQARPRIALARFYAAGLGVPKDMARAIALLKATPHEDAQRLLQELSAAGEAVPVPTRP